MNTDYRLYLRKPGWRVLVKPDDARMLCHLADTGSGEYHRIAAGEIYVEQGTEQYCLNCAIHKELVGTQRPVLRPPRWNNFAQADEADAIPLMEADGAADNPHPKRIPPRNKEDQ